MNNLIGKTMDETGANIHTYAVANGFAIVHDQEIHDSLTDARYITLEKGDKAVDVVVVSDGRITRNIRNI